MTTDSCFQMPCKTEMALLNPDCGFLPPPIKKRKKKTQPWEPLQIVLPVKCVAALMASPGPKGRGAGKRPIPDAEGKFSHISQGPLAPPPRTRGEGVCRALCNSAIGEQGLDSSRSHPHSPVTLYPSLLPLPFSSFHHRRKTC